MISSLFNRQEFALQVQHVKTPLERIRLFRETLNGIDNKLIEQFKGGADIESVITLRSQIMDVLLITAWQLFMRPDNPDVALLAVGGYGRGELNLCSDIDILVLIRAHKDKRYDGDIQQFLVFLFDIRLEIGHSVRSLKECVKQAKRDITIATSLMESRLLVGPQILFTQLRVVTGPKKIWSSAKFFAAKWEEQKQRHHKFGDTAYNLEPNIKEGPGGLRDIQMIGWVAKRHFGADSLQELVKHGFLTTRELEELIAGQNLLWKIRFALHMLTGRREDLLLFDYQRELATLFGYQDTHVIAVEQFMQSYYRTVMGLERLNEMLLQLFEEAILYPTKLKKASAINPRFQSNRGFIEVADNSIFGREPTALLEIFLLLQQLPKLKGVRAATIRGIRDNLHLIDAQFRANDVARGFFIAMFRQKRGLTHELRRMNRYGVLARYLPEFGNIVGRMQYDLFHHYTVDEHTLFVVRNLRRFTVPQFHAEFPMCSDLITNLPKPELLYIGGLYHDMAKGRGGDHSTLGAIDVERFCIDHGLSEFDAHVAAWLVKNHLLMSSTAQRKDISDPLVINEFANKLGDKLHLDYIYLLTVADMRATNPNIYNAWKASLLENLYHATKDALQRGLNNPLVRLERINDNRSAAQELLLKRGWPKDKIETFWSSVGSNYFLRHHPDEICWHVQEIFSTPESDYPIVAITNMEIRGSTAIFFYVPDRDYLFAAITAKLERLDLNILDARIITTKNGYAMNTFLVHENGGGLITGATRLQQVQRELRAQLLHEDLNGDYRVNIRLNRQLRFMQVNTRIIFEEDKKGERTIVKIVTGDRPGLLSSIAQAFKQCKIKLHNARIATFGETADDVFVITNQLGKPLADEQEKRTLEQTLRQYLMVS